MIQHRRFELRRELLPFESSVALSRVGERATTTLLITGINASNVSGEKLLTNSEQQPLLPLDRAFVIQFRANVRLEEGSFSGRVEHLASGRAAHFQSQEELLSFIRSTFTAIPDVQAGAEGA